MRGYLHRDGSVMMPISVEDLQNPQALYQAVGGYSYHMVIDKWSNAAAGACMILTSVPRCVVFHANLVDHSVPLTSFPVPTFAWLFLFVDIHNIQRLPVERARW